MSDNTLWAIFWIGLFTCIAIINIANSMQPRIIRQEEDREDD